MFHSEKLVLDVEVNLLLEPPQKVIMRVKSFGDVQITQSVDIYKILIDNRAIHLCNGQDERHINAYRMTRTPTFTYAANKTAQAKICLRCPLLYDEIICHHF